jgi:TPR repeat protein
MTTIKPYAARLAAIAILFAIGCGCPAIARAQSLSELVAACDRAAAAPTDNTRPADVVGVVSEKIDADTAIPACQAAANASPDDARMVMQLGRAYLAAKDYDAARMQFDRAKRMGNTIAINALGSFYAEGHGLPQDDTEAARYFKLAADAGFAVAQANLAFFYQKGRGGLPKDLVEAARLHRLAADQGNANSQNALGFFYQNGLGGLAKSDSEALRLYTLLNQIFGGYLFAKNQDSPVASG